MANVFGGGGGGSSKPCGDSGINRVLPTSPDALQASQVQTFSSTPNVYSKTASTPTGLNLRDFYTKSDIHRLLRVKADISSVYNKSEVDAKLAALEAQTNLSLIGFITEPEVDTKIAASFDNVISYLADNYYETNSIYTKSEINALFQGLTLGEDFVSLNPSTTLRNTVDPQSSEAISLTLVASSNPSITTIQHWIDDQSNSVGRIRKSGRVEFYGHMVLGQTIETWRPALDANDRRISGVADPIHRLDAVNKKYMENFIVKVISDIDQGKDGLYDIDCLTY
jgi:hypothetical protein